jgi:hypothetical protein
MPSNYNHLCPYCLTVTKQNYKCGTCGQETVVISKHARVPKKNAKRKEWASLFKAFPHILTVAPRTRALVDLGFQK